MTLLLLSGSPLAFQQGSSSIQDLLRHRFIYCASPDPNASIKIPTWAVITAIIGIETLMHLGSLGEPNFKTEKSLTACK